MAGKTCSTTDWQMEAVHEQFDIFERLVQPFQKVIDPSNNRLFFSAILEVFRKHLELSSENDTIRTITAEVTTVMTSVNNLRKSQGKPEKGKTFFELSFAVLVTNKNGYSKGFCKIPVFIVTFDLRSFFVDINGKLFQSWDAFMQENSLPACKFCYPVNGCYNVGGKLKVDFASSPAAIHSLVKSSMFSIDIGKIVDVGKVAASFLIKVAPLCFKTICDLTPVAKRFISQLYKKKNQILKLILLINDFNNNRNRFEVMMEPITILVPLAKDIQSDVLTAWIDVKKCLLSAYNELKKMFPEFFASASPSSQHDFLALAERVDSDTMRFENEANVKISEATKFISGSTQNTTGCVDTNNQTYIQQIFKDSIVDSALLGSGGKPFEKTTTKMLNVTKEIITNDHEAKFVFESVSCNVFEAYREKIDTYVKFLKAAASASTGDFDLAEFNKGLGIKGDPSEHYMQEVLQSCLESWRFTYKVNAKTNELKKNLKTILIPLWKIHNDEDAAGVYRCIGVRGAGTVSVPEVTSILEENFGNLATGIRTKQNSAGSLTTIYSEKGDVMVLLYQEVNKENTSEGLLVVEKWE